MIGVREAHEIIRAAVTISPTVETLPLSSCLGRVLAGQIMAPFGMPRFTNAAMDGFAVMHAEIAGSSRQTPVRLPVALEIPAGKKRTERLEPGSCARIMTGAPVPAGADTVVPFEDTSGFGSPVVEFFRAPKPGANIRHAGEEVALGEPVVPEGTRVTPATVGLLASFGIPSLTVFRRPKVSIMTVGDELRMPGESAPLLSIYNSNLPMLEACALAAGAEVIEALQLPDDPSLILEATRRSLETADLLVTAGGISSGQYDFIHETLTTLGVEEKFWKVAQKPGKPLYFGMAPSGVPVFSLPGNPVSALACFLEYAVPTLSRMQGTEPAPKLRACLEEPFPADPKRHRFRFGRVRTDGATLRCTLSPKMESHMLTATSGANCLVEAPASEMPLPEGALVDCALLPWETLS